MANYNNYHNSCGNVGGVQDNNCGTSLCGGGTMNCIVNLIIILIVLNFLSSILCDLSCDRNDGCC